MSSAILDYGAACSEHAFCGGKPFVLLKQQNNFIVAKQTLILQQKKTYKRISISFQVEWIMIVVTVFHCYNN